VATARARYRVVAFREAVTARRPVEPRILTATARSCTEPGQRERDLFAVPNSYGLQAYATRLRNRARAGEAVSAPAT